MNCAPFGKMPPSIRTRQLALSPLRLSQKLEDYVVHRAGAVVGISQSILDD